jgi:hypothetical protein
MHFLQSPVSSFCSWIQPVENTIDLCCFQTVRDKVSHSYKPAGRRPNLYSIYHSLYSHVSTVNSNECSAMAGWEGCTEKPHVWDMVKKLRPQYKLTPPWKCHILQIKYVVINSEASREASACSKQATTLVRTFVLTNLPTHFITTSDMILFGFLFGLIFFSIQEKILQNV